MAKNARQLCFDALCQVYRDKGYSSIVLDRVLKQCGAQPQEKTLAAALFYGVIERDLTLGYQIDRYSKRKCAKLDIEVAVILKMGLYQLLYLEQIPDGPPFMKPFPFANTQGKPAQRALSTRFCGRRSGMGNRLSCRWKTGFGGCLSVIPARNGC